MQNGTTVTSEEEIADADAGGKSLSEWLEHLERDQSMKLSSVIDQQNSALSQFEELQSSINVCLPSNLF